MSCFCVWRALSKCDAGLFNKLVGIYPELAVHERALDTLIDLFKKDQVPLNDFSFLLYPGELRFSTFHLKRQLLAEADY